LDEVDIPMDVVIETARRIRALEIQGATNVAIAAVNALSEQIQLSEEVDRASILSRLRRLRRSSSPPGRPSPS